MTRCRGKKKKRDGCSIEGRGSSRAANEPKQREQQCIDRGENTEREKRGGERYFVLNVKICSMLSEELEDRHMAILSGIVCGRPSVLHDGSQGKKNAVRG